jgi:PAS domain S-box-containing protein
MKSDKSTEQNKTKQIQFITGLIKQVSQPMIVTSADRHLLYWNAAFSKLTGYSNKELSNPIISAGLTAPEWHESETKAFERLQRTGKSQTFQKEYIRKDGARVPVDILLYQLSEGNGKVRYYIGLITDITKRKQAEEALKQSEEKYRSILEDVKEGYWEVDLAGNFTSYNNAICRLLGYSGKDMRGMNYRAYTSAEHVDKVYRDFNQVYRTGKPIRDMHYEIIRADGSKRFAETSVFPVRDGKVEIIGFRGVSHDITERRELEEYLERERKEFKLIIDSAPIIVFYKDKDGKFVRVNKALAESLQIPEEEFVGNTVFDLYSAEIAQAMTNDDQEVLKSGRPKLNIIEQYESTSGIRWVQTDKVPIVDKDGLPVGLIGFAQDITERKQMEEALKQSEEKYRSILEDMSEGYWEADLNGKFTSFNDATCRLLGYSDKEMAGLNYQDYISPEDLDRFYKTFNQDYVPGTPISNLHYQITRKDGSKRFIESSISTRINDKGEIIGFRGVSRDITKRMQMEEALRQSEEKYRTILEDMEEAYYETDLAGNFTFVNDALCRQLGYPRDESIGMNYHVYIPPEDIERVFNIFNEVYLTGRPIALFSNKEIKKDGTPIIAEISILPLRNEKGEIIGFRGVGRDATERLRMEWALRESEEKYRSVLERMEEAYSEVDLAGNFTFFNDALRRHLGYSREELMGMNYRVYTEPEMIDEVYKAYNHLYRTGKPIKLFAIKEIRKDGTRMIAEISVSPIRNEAGDITGFRQLSRDITERMQMEESLRRSEERYRTVLEDMEEAYYELDLAGNFTFFNDAMCRQLGYSKEELMGMNYKLYTPAEDVQKGIKAFNKVYRTGKPLYLSPLKRLRKDGTIAFAECSSFPLRNEKGETIGFRGIVRDVTARLRMEEALRQSEERYRTILEEMEEPYFEMDLAGRFTFFNNAMCRRLGYSREELMGMHYKVYTPPEENEKVFATFNKVYRTGEPAKLLDITTIRKDGTRNLSETSILPLRNEQGEITRFRGVTRDLTERKRAEEERRQLEQKAQLASRLASVGELASGVAHEINNPLTGVIGYAHLLLARKDISRDVRHDLEIINEGAQRVAGIVKKLLAFARQTKPEQRYVNINELIRNTLDLRAYELAASNIKVALQLTRDMPMTIVDPGQLQQVFLNLIINAETEMKLAHDKGRLTIKTERINNSIRILFKDNGLGIPKENLETIFDPFFTTREVGQGTGLGLSVCHGIVTEHNGRIWAESEPGKGATFIVELPLITEEGQSEPPEPVIEESPKVAKARILVIDDEPVIREFISQVLGEQGHTVETVDNAASALKMVKSKRYRLILLDIKMPGMSGVELYKQFQKIAPSLTKRVVFITGDVMGKRTIAFIEKTKTPYVMKPFDARELKTQLNRILAKK